jgi:hypothetical protein
MAEVLKCDICRRTEYDMPILAPISRYKLKRESRYGWDKLDICMDCEREIRLKVKNGGKDEIQNKTDGN